MTLRPRPLRRATALTLLALAGGCGDVYAFEPVELGTDERRARVARTDTQFLRAVYADVVGRAPESYDVVVRAEDGAEVARARVDELAFLEGVLGQVGDPAPVRALVAMGLAASPESALPPKAEVDDPDAFVADRFRALLGREPTAWERHAFVEAWRTDPAVGPAVVVRAIVGSREYQSR